jgi:hypothetical protein
MSLPSIVNSSNSSFGTGEASLNLSSIVNPSNSSFGTLCVLGNSVVTDVHQVPAVRVARSAVEDIPKETHQVIYNHLHEREWYVQPQLTSGLWIERRDRMIFDNGADALAITLEMKNAMVAAGALCYEPTIREINQVASTTEIHGVLYGSLRIHSPHGGYIETGRMQMLAIGTDVVLIPSYIQKALDVDPYQQAARMAKDNVMIRGNAEHVELANESKSIAIRRVNQVEPELLLTDEERSLLSKYSDSPITRDSDGLISVTGNYERKRSHTPTRAVLFDMK